MPVWIVGIEPTDFGDIAARYEEMRTLCMDNGVDCHSFDTAFGGQTAVLGEPDGEQQLES